MTETSVVVPLESISEDALVALVESFILMEGTDYGVHEVPLKVKTEQVLRQLQKGDVVIVYDPSEDSCTLKRKEDVKCRPLISSPN